MHVISRSRIVEFCKTYPEAYEPLDRWYRITCDAEWDNFADSG